MTDHKKSIRVVVPADAQFIEIVRLTLYGITSRVGFTYEEIEDMKVAVTEACNNAVLHAYVEEEAGVIDIHFEILEDRFCIKVKDDGKSFDVQSVITKVSSIHDKQIDDVEIGGLGIFLMNALMDEVLVKKNVGTEVTLIKRLKPKN